MMNHNFYHFFGFFLSKNSAPMKLEGIFDTEVKESVSHSTLDLHLSSIIFKKQSLLTCKVSSQNEPFKRVKSLDFSFYPEEQIYIAKVFAEKAFETKSGINNRIEKDSTPRDQIGVILIKIINKDLFDYDFLCQKYNQLEKQKGKRESTGPY